MGWQDSGFTMDRVLVERMVGAVVLVLLLVILAPVLLDGSADNRAITETAKAQDSDKRTQVIILNAPVNAPVNAPAKQPVQTSKVIEVSRDAAVKTRPAAGSPSRTRQKTSKPISEPISWPISKPPQGFAVQLGSFSEQANAKRYVAAVKAQGFEVFVIRAASAEGAVYRVYSGPENSRDKAGSLASQLKAVGHNGMIVKLGG